MLYLDKHQLTALDKLQTGSILNGGVGSGKSRTAIAYYYIRVCEGGIPMNDEGNTVLMSKPRNLYIITTARKRDTLEWEEELRFFDMGTNKNLNPSGVNVIIDSWNNIKKYSEVTNSFFIFDEQRLVGSGAWVKAFLSIAKHNEWVLLSATPGDTWMDYIPVFIANGFYKNRTEFIRRHVIFNQFVKFPKVERYIETGTLIKHKRQILVDMKYKQHTTRHYIDIPVGYDKLLYDKIMKDRWNVFKDAPIKNVSELCYTLRRVTNSDISRTIEITKLTKQHNKIIIFYNFNYELVLLRELADDLKIPRSEWNGHKHELLPKTDKWLYLVQYTSNAEGWNCIETNAMIFYSQNYSYRIREQSSGRIDRRNTPYENLYYYTFVSDSSMDQAIQKTLQSKKDFNEKDFVVF